MGMLDRYRKSGGFFQLLQLIETSPEAKQEKFLALIREESPVWESELRKRKLTFDRVCGWSQPYLMEICPRIPEKILAVALFPIAEDKRQSFVKSLAPGQRRAVDEFLKGPAPAAGEIFSCQTKILQEVRAMSQTGALKLDKIDIEMSIPENIEELLNSSFGPSSSTKTAGATKPVASPSAPIPATSAAASDEIIELRRRVHQLQTACEQLEKDNKSMKDKLEQIKKIA